MAKLFRMYDDEGDELYSRRATACITDEGEVYVFNPADDDSQKQEHIKPENIVFNNGMTLHDAMISGLYSKPFLFVESQQEGMLRDDDVRFKAMSSDKSKNLFLIDLTMEEAILLRDNFSLIINGIKKDKRKGWFKSWVAMLFKIRVG